MALEGEVYASLLRAFLPQRYSAAATGIEFLGVIVTFLISYLGYKAYKITNERKYKYFFYGFSFLGFNFLSHVVLNVLVNFDYVRFFVENKYRTFIYPLFGVYYFFLIAALLAYISLAIVYSDLKKSKTIWLFYVFGFLIGAYTFRSRVQFNLLSAMPLAFIASFAYEKYKSTKNKLQLYTVFSFICLFLYHVLVVFELDNQITYVIRYLFLLIGLVLLAIPLIKIFYGRKKK